MTLSQGTAMPDHNAPDRKPPEPPPSDPRGANTIDPGYSGEQLLQALYEELHRLAQARMRKLPPGQTIQATALVHEAFLRLGGPGKRWDNEAHFFGAAARAMRNIMVDQARRKGAVRHGGDRQRVPFDERLIEAATRHAPIEEVDRAIRKLEEVDPRKAEVVTLRFFAGMTVEQVAACLNLSNATVERDWTFARAWLRKELGPTRAPDEAAHAPDED